MKPSRLQPLRYLSLGLGAGLVAISTLEGIRPAEAHPRRRHSNDRPIAVVSPPVQRSYADEGYLYGPRQVYRPVPPQAYAPDPWQQAQQRAQECQRGRLIGGIVGGGLGYVASRDEGRSWAIPLGALLGSQMGCSTAAGRGPVPW